MIRPRSPRGRLNEALDTLVAMDRARRETGDPFWDLHREEAWQAAAETVADLAARGELGWVSAGQIAHYLRRQGADARMFVIQELVPRLPPGETP